MAEFCKCGSIIISGKCSNKNCALHRASSSTGKEKPLSAGARTKAATTDEKAPAVKKTRRASKCIVYNLYDKEVE